MSEAVHFIDTDYTINYRTKSPVPISEIVESLRSVEKLIYRTPIFIEKAYKGIRITDVQVFVSSIESGSLIEKFWIRYIFRDEENYEKAKEVVAKVIEDNAAVRTVVAVGIGALIGYGISTAIPALSPSTNITAYNNNIVNIGGDAKLTGKDIQAILDGITDKKTLAKDAVNVIRPAKADPDATIEIEGVNSVNISADVIRETPESYSPPIADEKTSKYTNVEIVVYASDRDKTSSGWAGIVPGVVDGRVKFVLDEKVDPSKIHGQLRFMADIVVTEKYSTSKKAYEPKQVEILKTNL